MSLLDACLGSDGDVAGLGEEVIVREGGKPVKRIFERKYSAPREARLFVLAALQHAMDAPSEFPEARIRTVYFDDSDHTSFYESVDGELSKRKYRLREYVRHDGGASNGARYSIEIKRREDSATEKLRELIYAPLPDGYSLTTFRDLIGAFEGMGASLSRLRAALPERELHADAVLSYERHRFDDPRVDARYNLDVGVTLCADAASAVSGVATLGHDIFEIKSAVPMELPRCLSGLGIEPMSFSKFVWGRETDYYL